MHWASYIPVCNTQSSARWRVKTKPRVNDNKLQLVSVQLLLEFTWKLSNKVPGSSFCESLGFDVSILCGLGVRPVVLGKNLSRWIFSGIIACATIHPQPSHSSIAYAKISYATRFTWI